MPIMDENDVSLPKATLSKMIKEFMPSDLRLAGDATDMLIECCTEFVSLLSSESNEVSTQEKRNTIHPEHVLKALKELGFQEFVPDVAATWEQWKEGNKCSHRLGGRKSAAEVGLTEEQQIELQQQLFAAARARSFQLPDQLVASAGQASASDMPQATSSSQGCATATETQVPLTSNTFSQAPETQAEAGGPSPMGNQRQARVGPACVTSGGEAMSLPYSLSPSTASQSGLFQIQPLFPQPMPSVPQPQAEVIRETSTSSPPGHSDRSEAAHLAVSLQLGTPSHQPQEPFQILQSVEVPNTDHETGQRQQQLDWQQMSQPVVLLHNGTQTVIPLQALLACVAQDPTSIPETKTMNQPAENLPQLPPMPSSPSFAQYAQLSALLSQKCDQSKMAATASKEHMQDEMKTEAMESFSQEAQAHKIHTDIVASSPSHFPIQQEACSFQGTQSPKLSTGVAPSPMTPVGQLRKDVMKDCGSVQSSSLSPQQAMHIPALLGLNVVSQHNTLAIGPDSGKDADEHERVTSSEMTIEEKSMARASSDRCDGQDR